MKDSTAELLKKIDQQHDWAEGQCWGGSGTRLSSSDHCRACDMTRNWFSDKQNGVESEYTFATDEGVISLRSAIARGCK